MQRKGPALPRRASARSSLSCRFTRDHLLQPFPVQGGLVGNLSVGVTAHPLHTRGSPPFAPAADVAAVSGVTRRLLGSELLPSSPVIHGEHPDVAAGDQLQGL